MKTACFSVVRMGSVVSLGIALVARSITSVRFLYMSKGGAKRKRVKGLKE